MIEKILRIFTMYQFQLFFTYMYMYFLTKSKKMDANYNLGQTLFSDIAFDLELKASQFYFLSISLIIVVKLTGYKTCLLCAILIFMFVLNFFIYFFFNIELIFLLLFTFCIVWLSFLPSLWKSCTCFVYFCIKQFLQIYNNFTDKHQLSFYYWIEVLVILSSIKKATWSTAWLILKHHWILLYTITGTN